MAVKASLHNASMVAGAAGSIILPQAIVNTWPSLFTALAPMTSNALPACTGSCGACGGSCLTSVSAALWLGCCAIKNQQKNNKE
ncbi:MAG: hypothetical protein ACI3XH_02185, partial [Phascolarctobacterium sp.]